MEIEALIVRNNSRKLKINVTSFLMIAYFAIEFLRYFTIISVLMGNILYVIIGSIGLSYTVYKKGLGKQRKILVFLYFYTLFGILGFWTNGNMDIQELLWPFAFWGLAITLLNSNINYNVGKRLYYATAFLLIMVMFFFGGIDNVNTAGSRNSISESMLIYLSFYAISAYQADQPISIYPALVGLLVSTMAVGRSGILTFLLLSSLFFLFQFDGKEQKIKSPYKWIFTMVVLAILLWLVYGVVEEFVVTAIYNFERRGLESVRTDMWRDYLIKASSSVQYVLLGAPISGTYLLDKFSHNLHNSFFMLHAKYGLIMLIATIFFIVKALIYYIKNRNYLFLSLLLATLFRMQFDYTNFNASLDITFFYLIFYPYYQQEIKPLDKV